MPLLERTRVEVYVPDLPHYRNLSLSFEREFAHAFGGCTKLPGLDGNYLSRDGSLIAERISVIYADIPISLSANFDVVRRYAAELKFAASEALAEESVLVAIGHIYHST